MVYDETPVEVPWTELPAATLRAVAEEFCTRDGTDYAAVEMSLDERVGLLLSQLESGSARLVFETESQTLGIIPNDGT